MTTRRVKVYGFNGFVARGLVPGRQARVIVAARSLAEARRILDAPGSPTGWPGHDYIGETGNAKELALATELGDIFAQPLNPSDGRDWVRIA
jgi:hypothetical protein